MRLAHVIQGARGEVLCCSSWALAWPHLLLLLANMCPDRGKWLSDPSCPYASHYSILCCCFGKACSTTEVSRINHLFQLHHKGTEQVPVCMEVYAPCSTKLCTRRCTGVCSLMCMRALALLMTAESPTSSPHLHITAQSSAYLLESHLAVSSSSSSSPSSPAILLLLYLDPPGP